MKLRRYALTIALLLCAALFIACGDDTDDAAAGPTDATASPTGHAASDPVFPLVITDDAGVEITLDAPPETIVALAPSFVEVLFAMGAGDTIVAADQNTDFPSEAESIPKVSGFEPSVEGIASYEPDLVLMCCFDAGGLQSALTQLGIPTMYFGTPATVDGVYRQIETIGLVTGHSAEAATVVSGMQTDIDAVVAGIEGDGPTVYFELDPGLYTIGPGSFPHEVLTLLGASNIAEPTGESYPQLSTEAVISADPEVIVLADGDFGESPETVAARPGWAGVSAVRDGRVYPVAGAMLNHASPRLVDDIEQLVGLLYP